MIPFKQFNARLQAHVKQLTKNINTLFTIALDKDELWNVYLDSFPEGTNPMYRKRREFDCSCCRHFVKAFGNVVSLDGGVVTTIWDFDAGDSDMQAVVDALAKFVKVKRIENVFVTRDLSFGTDKSYEMGEDGKTKEWNHFHCTIDGKFKYTGRETIGSAMSEYNSTRQVFERSLKELSIDSVETVLDLIRQKSLYKGEEWKANLEKFLMLQKKYNSSKHKDLFCWVESVAVGPVIGKIRNHSIGTLLIDLSEGMDLDKALTRYEKVVAPSNYMRPKEVFTKKMIEDAEKMLTEEGLIDSLGRRHATLDDITIQNILFADRKVSRKLTKGSIFDEMKEDQGVSQKSLGRVEEISIDDFLKGVLPTATSLEVYLENRHSQNMVSLIAPENKESQTLFKWNNGFSWAYNGNMTDSMKERVKSAGGKVDGVLRFSIQWNDKGDNNIDFDAHAHEPNHNHIYFGQRNGHRSGGNLDVDIRVPGKAIAVENITWPDRNRLQEGVYEFKVHNFAGRTSQGGFTAEIEFDGEIHQFECARNLRGNEYVDVAKVEYSRANGFKLIPVINSTMTPRKTWNLMTQQFHPVHVCMYSPNYWDEQDGIGHRHYFFMLKGAVNEESPNGFFNEYLRDEFMKHKRVFSALGGKMKVEPTDSQLSGVGFSATKRDELTVRVGGRVNRILKIKF